MSDAFAQAVDAAREWKRKSDAMMGVQMRREGISQVTVFPTARCQIGEYLFKFAADGEPVLLEGDD